jgi:hypothetical protein
MLAAFILKKRIQNSDSQNFSAMLSLLKNLFHRPAIRFGLAKRGHGGRFRDPRFVSFIAQNNRKALNTDLKDAMLQGRKIFRYALVAALVCGGAWVLVESAHALSMF